MFSSYRCYRYLFILFIAVFFCGCSFDWLGGMLTPEAPARPVEPMAVLIHLDGEIATFHSTTGLFASTETDLYGLEKTLRKLTLDPMVKELVLRIGAPDLSLPVAGEIAEAIGEVSAKGKTVTCHLDSGDNITYWLAARACPKILLSPAGSIEALGLSIEAVFFKELLDSLGIEANMLNIGKYKSAAEPFTRDSMSPAAREAATSLLDALHGQFVAGIAKARNMTIEGVQKIIDEGPYDAKEAVALKLVDDVIPLGTFLGELDAKYEGGVVDDYGHPPAKPFDWTHLLKLLGSDSADKEKDQSPSIAIVPAIGPIGSGTGEGALGQMSGISDLAMIRSLQELADDDAVKGVVLRIDSPGGSALASDNIWHAVRALAERKPVIASMGSVAASGGYYIAAGATEVFASPATITGSIGVVGGKMVVRDAVAKVGIRTERIQRGARAHLLSPFTPFSDSDKEVLTRLMQSAYDTFIDRVAMGRKLERTQVLALAQGRIWAGSEAIAQKLVDHEGSLRAAVNRAKELAKLPSTATEGIYPKPRSIFEQLAESLSDPQGVTLRVATRHLRSVSDLLTLQTLLRHHAVLAYPSILYDVR